MAELTRDPSEQDWAAHLTDKLEAFTSFIRDRATRPALGIARIAIVAVVALIVGLVVLVVLGIALITLFDHDVFRGRVWATDFLFGGMLICAGAFLLAVSARARRSSG